MNQLTAQQALMDDFADVHSPESYTGTYFDGKSSARRYANLLIVGNHVSLLGDNLSRRVHGSELSINAPARHGALLIKFADGAVCELPATRTLFNRLRMAGAKVPDLALGANVLSGDWRLVALVLAFLVGVLVAAYVWLIPAAAEIVAPMIPTGVKQSLGAQTLRTLDARWLQPTRLDEATQQQIRERFAKLQSHQQQPLARLELRSVTKDSKDKKDNKDTSKKDDDTTAGANAFALPGGTIILTDEMVRLLKGDMDAISGVLAHELGHVLFDHGTKGVLKATALTALGSTLIGDYSNILATLPAVVGHLKYSREAEAQADSVAFDLLCAKRIDPTRTALLFEEIMKKEKQGGLASGIPEFLRSHPSNNYRAEVFKERCPAAN